MVVVVVAVALVVVVVVAVAVAKCGLAGRSMRTDGFTAKPLAATDGYTYAFVVAMAGVAACRGEGRGGRNRACWQCGRHGGLQSAATHNHTHTHTHIHSANVFGT